MASGGNGSLPAQPSAVPTCLPGGLRRALEYFKGRVSGLLGTNNVEIELDADPDHRWRLNRIEIPAVTGCTDLDLNFSPSTNLLPIRRLNLRVGEEKEVKAAWLRFPSFELEPLSQVYRRVDESTYRYESGGGKFVADLTVDSVGFVTNYPGIWQAEEDDS